MKPLHPCADFSLEEPLHALGVLGRAAAAEVGADAAELNPARASHCPGAKAQFLYAAVGTTEAVP
jgi:hypothetical protein